MTLMHINPDAVASPERGCGLRVDGAAYSCLGAGSGGRPLHTFLIDPPKPLPDDFKLAAVGITPIMVLNDKGQNGTMLFNQDGDLVIDSFNISPAEVQRLVITALGEGTDWTPPIIKRAVVVPAEFAEAVQISPQFQAWNGSACHHFFDWVGEKHYPYVSDFAEEAYRFLMMGKPAVSRRIALSPALISKITPRYSKHVLVHPKAHVENWQDFDDEADVTDGWSQSWVCPTHNHRHLAPNSDKDNFVPHCLGLAWSAIDGEPVLQLAKTDFEQRRVKRTAGTSYYGLRPPTGSKVEFKPAAFMSFKMNTIHLVAQSEAMLAARQAEAAAFRARGLNLEIVQE